MTTDSDCGAKQSDIIPMPKLLLAPELALQSTEVGITASFPAFLPHSKSTAPQLLIPPESKPKPHTNFLTICDRCNSSLTSMNLNRRVSLTPSCSSSSFKTPSNQSFRATSERSTHRSCLRKEVFTIWNAVVTIFLHTLRSSSPLSFK